MEDHLDRDIDDRGSRRMSWAWVYGMATILVFLALMPLVFIVSSNFAPSEIVDEQGEQLSELDKRATHIANMVEAMKGDNVKDLRQVVTALSEQVQSLQRQLQQVDTSKVKQDTENTLNFRPWKELQKTNEAAKEELAEAGQNITAWLDRVAEFERSDEAKRIASNADLLKQYHLLASSATETIATVNSLSDDLRDFARPVEEAIMLGYMDVPPPDKLVSSIEEIHNEANTLRKKYRDMLQELDVLLREVPQDAPEDGPSFEVALAMMDQQTAEKRREEVYRRIETEQERMIQEVTDFRLAADKRAAEAEKERDKKIADARAEAAELAGESQATLIVESARAVAAEMARQVDLKKKKNAEEQLEHEYTLAKPEIIRRLGPFIRDGYAQPHGYMNRDIATKGKMSLSAMRASKALQTDREGQEVLVRIATTQNDRFQNDFPQSMGGEFGWKMLDKESVAKAQDLLIKFGDRMVKDGLLAE